MNKYFGAIVRSIPDNCSDIPIVRQSLTLISATTWFPSHLSEKPVIQTSGSGQGRCNDQRSSMSELAWRQQLSQVTRSAFELSLRRPPQAGVSGMDQRCCQFSILRMTVIKTTTSYAACASPATTAANLSSIWFQPSTCPLFFAFSMVSFPTKVSFV